VYKYLLGTAISAAIMASPAMAQQAPALGDPVAGALSNLMITPPSATGAMRNGLPATTTDSFVYQAGGQAELIYGDEGVYDIPPYFEFTKEHRIAAGIFGQRDAGLTTGHGSLLPDAWGGDEFVKGPEFDVSGPTLDSGAASVADQLLNNTGLGGLNNTVNQAVGQALPGAGGAPTSEPGF
jgi:hypothetical protein